MKLRINKNQVVNCTTREEVSQFFNLIKEVDGINESLGNLQLRWSSFREKTCFVFYHNEIQFGGIDYLDNYQIITTQDFLTMHSEPFMGYFESDGTEATYNNIISVIDSVVPDNKHSTFNFRGDLKGLCYLVIDDEMNGYYNINIPKHYRKCNLDHYLHLIDHIGDTTEMTEEPETIDSTQPMEENTEIKTSEALLSNVDHTAELADLRKQLAESVERERIANNIIAEKRKEIEDNKNSINELEDMCTVLKKDYDKLDAELGQTKALYDTERAAHGSTIEKLNEAKVKSDKWDAIPQYFCMRGDLDRGREIKAIFKRKGFYSVKYNFNSPLIIYYGIDDRVKAIDDEEELYYLLLATQTITELPPLNEKEEVEEVWLKPTDYYIWKYNDSILGSKWRVSQFDGIIDTDVAILPFNAETEKLIGTTDEPAKKYKFMGIKPYFNQE